MSSGKVSPSPNPIEQNLANNINVNNNNSNTEIGIVVISSTAMNSTVPAATVPNPQPAVFEIETVKVHVPHKHLFEAYVLWFPLGILGAHHFYLRRYAFGFVYFFTLGLCGIGWIVDAFRLPQLVRDANDRMEHPEVERPLDVLDVYAMWFPFGIFGLHHFYMGRITWGIMYSWTTGLYGLGWLVDAFRIPSLVRQANKDLPVQRLMEDHPRNAELSTAYLLGVTPAGLFGIHHFYMGQWRYGCFYLYTLGGAGIGWIVDWFRMPVLVNRVKNPDQFPLKNSQKHLDSAYICALPFGLLGGHHFYLGNNKMGTIYFFTLGIFAIGWLIDIVRMPILVKEANKKLKRERELVEGIRRRLGIVPAVIMPQGILPEPTAFNHAVPGYPNPNQVGMNETPILQPPSYSEAMSQSTQPPAFHISHPEAGASGGAVGGVVDQKTVPPLEKKEHETTM